MKEVITILYVEDEKMMQEELAEVIELFCKKLYLANNGKEGLALYEKHNPDIIITDIAMPLMNGTVMSQKIKELKEDAHIIFTTAFSDAEYFQKAIELQVDGYILKPIDISLLEKKILSITKNIQLQKEKVLLQEERFTTMSDMLSAIAHQWRQPLNVINGILYNLSDAYKYNELTKEYFQEMLTMANNNLQFMSKTIDDFKNFSKPSEMRDFSFKEIRAAIESIVLAPLQANKIKLSFDIQEKVILHGAMNELLHTLLNLINNAKDALIESKTQEAEICIKIQKSEKKIFIRIKDNANGIAKEIQEKIFEPYFTTKEEINGTGIGLYLSKLTLQRSFDATLLLEKSSSEGSTFLICLVQR